MRMNRKFSKEETKMSQKYLKKRCFNIHSNQKNANSNNFGISSHFSQKGKYQQIRDKKCWRGWKERELTFTVCGMTKCYSHSGNWYEEFS